MPSVWDGYLQRCEADTDIAEYLPLLHGYARLYKGVRVLEIGTRDANSTLAFLAAAQQVGGHVWSVDADPEVLTRQDGIAPYLPCEEWTFTCGLSCERAVVAEQPEKVDILFNDSGHEYKLTLDELSIYMPRLVPGGTALIHDTRLVYDHYAVRRALNVYCARNGLTWRDLPGQYGLAVITLDREG